MNNDKYSAKVKFGEVEFEVSGDKEFVEKHISEWKDKLNNMSLVKPISSIPDVGVAKVGNDEIKDLPEFYSTRKPQTQNESIAVFGYYFEHKDGKKEFDAKDLLTAFDQVRVKRPGNIHDALQKCYKRTNYILPVSGTRNWRLAVDGIKKVELMPEGGSGEKE